MIAGPDEPDGPDGVEGFSISNCTCSITRVNVSRVVNRKYTTSLFTFSIFLLGTLISNSAPAATSRFFSCTLLEVTGVANAISCLRFTSSPFGFTIRHTVLYPLGAFNAAKSTFNTVSPLSTYSLPTSNTGAALGLKSSTGGGNTSSSAFSVTV